MTAVLAHLALMDPERTVLALVMCLLALDWLATWLWFR